MGSCTPTLICIDVAVIVFTYLLLSIETVIPKKQFAFRRNKHTNKKDGGKQAASTDFSS